MTQTEFLCAVMLSALFCGTALAALVGEVARWAGTYRKETHDQD